MKLRQFFLQHPPVRARIALWLGSLIAVGLLGYLYLLTGPAYEFQLFFTLPLLVVAWFVSAQRAYVLAVLTVVLWYLAERQLGGVGGERSILMFNTLIRASMFFGVIWLVNQLRLALKTPKSE